MLTHFDAYVMVDWSASAQPKRGRDSVWWCVGRRLGTGLRVEEPENVRTREDALRAITAELRACVADGLSVLVGLDFPYGYPGGFARSLGLAGVPWRATWDELSRRIRDSQTASTNNRFEVAATLNEIIAAGVPGPFWGCPESAANASLLTTKPAFPYGVLAEFRITERRISGPKATWQLFYNGSVGSQALLGIPYLAKLRDSAPLAGVSQIWPFETGATLPPRAEGRGRVIHAEIYPSFISASSRPGEVKDSVQVRALVEYFADSDQHGRLGAHFSAPARLPLRQQAHVLTEEGWILGVA